MANAHKMKIHVRPSIRVLTDFRPLSKPTAKKQKGKTQAPKKYGDSPKNKLIFKNIPKKSQIPERGGLM